MSAYGKPSPKHWKLQWCEPNGNAKVHLISVCNVEVRVEGKKNKQDETRKINFKNLYVKNGYFIQFPYNLFCSLLDI